MGWGRGDPCLKSGRERLPSAAWACGDLLPGEPAASAQGWELEALNWGTALLLALVSSCGEQWRLPSPGVSPTMCWWEKMYFQLLGWLPGRCSTDVLNMQGQGCLLLTSFVLDSRPVPS